ncbi:MAG: DUF6935 domain-containing protein [Spirochaetia bacterium]
MRKILVLLLVFGISPVLYSEETVISIPSDIDTIEEFLTFRDGTADTPEGGAAVLIQALLLFEQDHSLGHDALVIALDRNNLSQSSDGYKGFTYPPSLREYVNRYIKEKPYLARSYIQSTTPQGGYELPEELEITISKNIHSKITEDRVKVFIHSTGADTPRPVTIQRNNRGVWKAAELSSLFVGVRPPAETVDDDL